MLLKLYKIMKNSKESDKCFEKKVERVIMKGNSSLAFIDSQNLKWSSIKICQ